MAESDEDALTKVVWGEARGETEAGKIAAAWTVKNRTLKSKKTIQFESSKNNGTKWQFDGYKRYIDNPPNLKDAGAKATVDACRKVAQGVIAGTTADNTAGATHFNTEAVPPRAAGIGNMERLDPKSTDETFVPVAHHKQIGGHYFFKGIRPYK
jgi:spore germination cell wall hydrolase CwlJ-like protein